MSLRFCFELDAVEDIEPWGQGEDRKLHWFGLTSGRYWVSTPLGEALRYTEEQLKLWALPSPYVDYQVARIFEDLQYVLPQVLEPVPPDIAAIVSDDSWFARAENWIEGSGNEAERSDLCYEATEWYLERKLDSSYLVNGPVFHFWRVNDEVLVRWAPTGENWNGIWLTPQGKFTVSAGEFKSAVYEFLHGVLAAMQDRVDSIQAKGWDRPDCKLDIAQLVQEQVQRSAWVRELEERLHETDWDVVRRSIERLAMEF
jgi:hypothetical protein